MNSGLPIAIGVLVILSTSLHAESPTDTLPDIEPVKTFWGSGSSVGAQRVTSRLYKLKPEEYKKSADLDAPVAVTILSTGRLVKGLEKIQDRIVDVRVTNPNPYAIFFQGRQYLDNKTIKPVWGALKDGEWKIVGWDWCGTGIRDWEIEPHGSIDLMLYLHPDLPEQRIYGRFYRVSQPSVQSEYLLYEKPSLANSHPKHPDVNKHAVRDRQTPYSPYEAYPLGLKSAEKILGIYREQYEIQRKEADEKEATESYRSKLRITMRSLIDEHAKFVSYAEQDKILTAGQVKVVVTIKNASFPILKQKDIESLSCEQLIQSIQNESLTLGPLVKQFFEKIDNAKRRTTP